MVGRSSVIARMVVKTFRLADANFAHAGQVDLVFQEELIWMNIY